MKQATKKQSSRQDATPGFAIKIAKTTDLGIAMLIAEDEEGHYEPIGPVASVNEAYEIASNDLHNRLDAHMEHGESPLCPYAYRVWAAGLLGTYRTAWLILATEL